MKRDTITVPADLFLEMYNYLRSELEGTYGFTEDTSKFEPYVKLCNLPRLHITGTRWFNGRSGTTYFKFRIYANSEIVHTSEQRNGYGDQPLFDALNWLADNRPEWVPGWDNRRLATIYLREVLQVTYDLGDVSRERDL